VFARVELEVGWDWPDPRLPERLKPRGRLLPETLQGCRCWRTGTGVRADARLMVQAAMY
jgi:hypothetical protein